MGYIIAGLAIAAVGAGVSAKGTADNAESQKDAALNNILLENKFAKKWTGKAEALQADQLDKLYNLGNIFDRFESTGAFGNTSVLKNLRTAQEDFAALGAGDFTKFDKQLRSVMNDNLVTTFGSGAPIGTYAGLSADAIMNFRRTGVSDATAITGFLSQESNNLLSMEFGVLDRGFERTFGIDRQRLNTAQGNYSTAAATAGVGTSAYGSAMQSIGTSIASYGLASQGKTPPSNGSGYGAPPKAIPLTESGQPIGYSVGASGYYVPNAPTSYSAPVSYGSARPANNSYPSYVPPTATFLPSNPSSGSVGVLPSVMGSGPPTYEQAETYALRRESAFSMYGAGAWEPQPWQSLVSTGAQIVR